MCYGTRRFNVAFTRALQYVIIYNKTYYSSPNFSDNLIKYITFHIITLIREQCDLH